MSDRESSPERNVKEGTPNGSADSYSPERRHKRPVSRSKSGSRDRSRSYTPKRRQRSRSPGSNRRRHLGDRDNPAATRCLGVFGLSLYTQTRHLRDVFSKYGNIDEITIVTDAQTGRSRGFAFVYFENLEDAKRAKDDCNGIEIDNRKIRVDFSITKRPHTPTPGIYMGRPSHGDGMTGNHRFARFSRRSRGRRGHGGYGGGYGGGHDRYDDRRDYRRDYRDDYYREDYRREEYRRSPSPYYGGGGGGGGRRYRRSRSRSYSPRGEYGD
ncbi:transformer-2 protein homolog alpha-like isoform X2 [Pollicipes pollicipes]|uniref:transformer-2 protein homolog alpha-like isoform X2 n=1 Tax=Pollicipes pollicipes TaxID=41117 RepID=UPI00188596D0|nr:transformer-2 protein homolog alpha-like isoform X2 [Pollicipes pollicipes]